MKRRIRKKKLKQKIECINYKINHNNQIRKADKSINGFPVNLVIPFRNFGLQLNKSILIRSLKRGEY